MLRKIRQTVIRKKSDTQGAAERTTDIFTTSVTDPPEIEYICFRNKEAKKKMFMMTSAMRVSSNR